jgi:hypothetical protein
MAPRSLYILRLHRTRGNCRRCRRSPVRPSFSGGCQLIAHLDPISGARRAKISPRTPPEITSRDQLIDQRLHLRCNIALCLEANHLRIHCARMRPSYNTHLGRPQSVRSCAQICLRWLLDAAQPRQEPRFRCAMPPGRRRDVECFLR